MKLLAIQGHSKNNQKLYNLTIKNHIDYFNKYNIDYLTKVESYTPYVRFEIITQMLNFYDFVFTIGSDCLFTNFNKYILDFIDCQKNLNICIEGTNLTYVNGEIMFFKKGSQQFIYWLNEQQKTHCNEEYGFQSMLNKLVITNKQLCCKNIHFIQPKTLQSYYSVDYQLLWRQQHVSNWNELTWQPNDFILHTLGGNNEYKFQTIKNFMKKYNF